MLRRNGSATTSLVVSLVVFTGLTTAAVVFAPQFAGADGSTGSSSNQAEPVHEREVVARSIAALLGSSHQVLAIHDRESSPYVEAVLWVDDRYNRGVIDPAEVAIVAHSRVLQTVTWFSLQPDDEEHERWDSFENAALRPDQIHTPGFCDRWRSHYAVVPRVIATGISDLRVKIAPQTNTETAVVEMTLIWPDDSTDSPTETSAQVHVALRRN